MFLQLLSYTLCKGPVEVQPWRVKSSFNPRFSSLNTVQLAICVSPTADMTTLFPILKFSLNTLPSGSR